ncbi:hypothetical protein GDO81_016753 [Engystomops pustulosus]|uniref:Secreted protein n=1 Tax=Engystomops pustulosus TaxID=76066 RepID=A0AAV7AEW9_ENGPU|nr:hypothetical protein GDO81_016753 [Engystomops pustulosus]
MFVPGHMFLCSAGLATVGLGHCQAVSVAPCLGLVTGCCVPGCLRAASFSPCLSTICHWKFHQTCFSLTPRDQVSLHCGAAI